MLLPATDVNKHRDSQQTLCRQWETLEPSALNRMFPSNPSPEGPGNPVEEVPEKNARSSRDGGHHGNTRPSKYSRINAHVNSQRLEQHAQGQSGSAPHSMGVGGCPWAKRSGHMPPTPTQKLFPIDNHLQMKQLVVFCKGVAVGRQTALQGSLPSSRCPTKMNSTPLGVLGLILCVRALFLF